MEVAQENIILEIKNGSYSYENGTKVLDQVSVKIKKGEKIAVMGANGAGKSTFFLCMNGVLLLDQGAVFLHGRKVEKKDFKELHQRVGIVFQDPDSQIIASTVMSEVSFGPMNLKLPRDEVVRRTEEALCYMGLQEYKNRVPHSLSGGEKKRVSIAGIVAMEPEVIVFDEPATGLDPYHQQMLEEVLNRLKDEGKTVLLSTHDVDFAYRFAERILVFSHGQIVADGSPEEIFQNREILSAAHLKQPVLLEIYQALVTGKKIKGVGSPPKEVKQFLDLF